MFRKDEEFDDVAHYKRSRNNSRELEEEYTSSSRFERRDDYVYEDVHQEHTEKDNSQSSYDEYQEKYQNENDNKQNSYDDYQKKYQQNPSQNSPKKKKRTSTAVIIIVVIIVYIFFNFLVSFMEVEDYEGSDYSEESTEKVEEKADEFEKYVIKNKEVNSAQFVKEYQAAKKNRIKYNRIQRNYVSGDYEKSYVINARYVQSEYSADYKTYHCMYDDYEKYDGKSILSCGLSEVDEFKYPKDFLSAFAEKGIRLSNYDLDVTESADYYNINGVFYSKEFCDLVVKYSKDKTI